MNKKVFAIMLVVVFTLAGCGEKTNDTADSTSTNSSDAISSIDIVSSDKTTNSGDSDDYSGTSTSSVQETESSSLSIHEHTFAGSWSNDETYHWHVSTCGHDVISDKEKHLFEDEVVNATYEEEGFTKHVCTICGYSYKDSYTAKLVHGYSTDWSFDAASHWHICTDEGYGKLTKDFGSHEFQEIVTEPTYESEGYTSHTCTVCGYSYKDSYTAKLVHGYSTDWSFDAASHWHICTDEGYGKLTKDFGSHEFQEIVTEPTYESEGYTSHTCTVCGYSYDDNYIDKLIRTYTITWQNWDGSVLEVDVIEEGQTPKYDGDTPAKPEDETYTYIFKGWSPEIKAATSDQTYVATFTNEKIKYVISFDLNGGTSASYEGSKTVEEFDTNVFFFDLDKEECNFRGWYYNGKKVFDETGKLYFTPKMEKEMTFVAIFEQNVRMYVYTNMSEAGTISGDDYYPFNTYVDLSARPYQGYKFVGWYYQGAFGWNSTSDLNILLSNTKDYKYMMWDKDVIIEARFALDSFEIKLHSNDKDYGLVLLKSLQNKSDEYLSFYSEKREYTSKVTIAAYSKTDVRFLGWYDDDGKLVTTNAVYIFNMPNHDYSLEAKWNHFKIEYNLNGGTNNEFNPTEYTIDDEPIVLNTPTKKDYSFLGWRRGGDFVNAIDPNWADHVTLEAIWKATDYSISYHLDGGTNSDENPHSYTVESQEIVFLSPAKRGYDFQGWYLDQSFETKATKISSGSYGDINLYAKWKAIDYSLTYDLNGGVNSDDNPTSYTIEDEIVLSDVRKDGYTFAGWYLNDEKIDVIEKGTIGNLTIEARWTADLQKLIVISEDTSKGTVEIVAGESYTDEEITVKATPAEGCVFEGWYDGDKRVSVDETYTFTMPSTNYSLVAKFYTAEEELARKKSLGIIPEIDSEAKTLTYGLYPQNHVNDEATIASLNALTTKEKSNGWYFYDGSYYAKKSAKPCSSSCKFGDGTKIVEGTEYWFKCEPITWDILTSNDGTYSLVAHSLLDTHEYNEYYSGTKDGVYDNNYEKSEIREWLNGAFYDSAFALGNSLIQTVTVDNSAATTKYSGNKYACDNTEDKVYLLSYQDYMNADYFADNAARRCKVTDWVKANYAWYSTNISYLGNSNYWTRSPSSDDSSDAWSVSTDGSLFENSFVSDSYYYCVRPAITIKVA